MSARKQNLATAVAQIRSAISEALLAADVAIRKALRVGQLIGEAKPLVGHSNFQSWIEKEFPQISYDTANRWSQMAANVTLACGVDPAKLSLPLSAILAAAPDSLPATERAAQQLLLDFTANKTIKECMQAIVVDGDEAYRLTRAHHGRTKGGYHEEDRKDYPKFIAYHLSDVSAHLKSWRNYTGPQMEATAEAFKVALAKWPTPLLDTLRKQLTEELKRR
jgi:hypothetical protein